MTASINMDTTTTTQSISQNDNFSLTSYSLQGFLQFLMHNSKQILLSIQDDYKICKAAGKKLYHHLWIYTHGIATLCATKMCRFTDEEISTMITEVCMSILKKLKEGENND